MVYGKITQVLPPLRRPKLSNKAQENEDEFLKDYKNLIGIGMIGDSNYIGIILNGSIQEVKSKVKTLFSFFKNK